MIYKLFLFGEKQLFATIQFPGPEAREGDIFTFEEKRYKVLRVIHYLTRIVFDENGNNKNRFRSGSDKDFVENGPVPELIITEIPEL